MSVRAFVLVSAASALLAGCAAAPSAVASSAGSPAFDLVLRGGSIYDGSGGPPFIGDVAVRQDRIVAVAPRISGSGRSEIDAAGLAVAPGFINMLSWATESLIEDGRSQSDIRQGVTLEVFGEGSSMGPLNPEMKRQEAEEQGDIRYPITWTSLGEYLTMLEKKGVSPNVASFVGATTVRVHELGRNDVDPTPAQLDRMRGLVRDAMNEGALGVGSSLIYAPAYFAETPELIALASEAAKCGGLYISHIRDEGPKLLESIDELIEIADKSGAPAEIYHLKQSGRENWGKLDAAIARVEAARARGLKITADMYTYPASSTGLDAAMPLWVQEGGIDAWVKRLQDPPTRARLLAEMGRAEGSENMKLLVHEPDKVLLLAFKNPALKPLTGKTLADVARIRGKSPQETAADLIIEDHTRIQVAYFGMNEANVARQTSLPWVSFGSDASSQAPEGVFLKSSTHPRAYGNFARVLGKYARDEKRLSLQEAVRRLSAFPASNLGLADRGALKPGYFADIVLFDPAKIGDTATFEKPQSYAIGMRHVFVNGMQVLRDGEHVGATPGRFVKGRGAGKCPA
ncbi:amidohydrolase family protein [Sphingosinicella sp. BN140058]|uniref:N-acyl-D-amino-acid deacylase family protein n=1 Tax=Sphingosinicella sp. BN140058 TaxID=1892855 RepID=UPI00101121B5|nr:D-aminoacylase [Sphingosinicella sp. BN140058]QAY78453.1 D-aminoacylase [Sphingosinicella sp. BN140058]